MTQIPPHPSLTQYFQSRDSIVKLLYQLADFAEQRDLTIIVDKQIDGRIPSNHLATNAGAFNQLSFKNIVEEDIQPVYEPFRIGVVGEFVRGKTTLLNALLEREVLASDLRPNTATCTTLKYGEIDHLKVTYFDSTGLETVDIKTQSLAADLALYTSDAAMDQEQYEAIMRHDEQSLAEQVEGVEVSLSSEFLRQREYELVDTPGLGSIFDTHQMSTHNAIPQMDAVLFLTQFDPLIGEEEMIFLGSLRGYLNRFLFVLTKVDLAEKEPNPHEVVNKAIDFTQVAISTNLQLQNTPIYPISAIAAVRDNRYKESGIIQLAEALDQFIACSCGRERLVKLYRSANTYRLWIEQDIQRELDDLHRQIAQLAEAEDQLRADINSVELFGRDLNTLLRAQTEQLAQSLLNHISQLPERLRIAVAEALDALNLEALQEVPVNLRPTVHDVVQVWLKEQEATFMQGAGLLQNDARFFLSKIVHRDVQIQWANTNSTLTFTPPDLPSLDTLMEKLKLRIMFASVMGIVKFIRERIKREFLKPQPPSNQNAYQKIVLNENNRASIYNQSKRLFSEWAQSLHLYLENKIIQATTHYRKQIEEQIGLIDCQRTQLKQRLNLVEIQLNQMHSISKLGTGKPYS